VHPVPRRLPHVAGLGLAAAARHPQQVHGPQRVEPGEDEAALELAARVQHGSVDGARLPHPGQGVDHAVVDDDPALGVLLADLLELEGTALGLAQPLAHSRAPGRGP
jgi:hypothetical protein